MKVGPRVLPDKLRGSAWPPSARTVRRAVKSVNERDPCHYLPPFRIRSGYYSGTAGDESEEGAGNDRSVCSESPGLHVDYNGTNNGLRPRKGGANPTKRVLVRIEGCNPPS